MNDAKEIFLAALECATPEDLASYLNQACAGDTELRTRVEELLSARRAAGNFLGGAWSSPTEATSPLAEAAGTVIGPYKLLQQIGEGGMGVVFMAEQSHPVQRTVALKVIKPGMDTRQVIARFEAERQAVALMDHPNIARVIDAGTTDSGRPYFVMDLVKGVPITDYCDRQQLPIRVRLELMSAVCHAVQHAHQKGIIHRDLKPSNVLVAEYDGRPVAKIIDFGVAKATAQRLTEKTMFTEYGQLIGTFEYMSPEQARFNQLDVDTRSDIYSLGVLLYEVLAGSTPLEKERLRSAAFDEVLRMICEEEPPRPSLRLSSSQALPSISAQRHIEPEKLKKLVRGELDWIVMKCLEKDRNRRYETASSLAADLHRYLSDEPVEARPSTRTYRLKKLIRRNKASVLAGSAIVAALLIGLTLSSIGAGAAIAAALLVGLILATVGVIQARQQAARADAAAVRAMSINKYLQQMLQSADPDKRGGQEITLRQLLDEFSAGLSDQFGSQPEIEADIQRTIGLAYRRLDANKCEEHLKRAMDLRRDLVGEQHVEFAECLVDYAIALREQWRPHDSESYLRRALAIYKKQGTRGRPMIRAFEILQIVLLLQNRLSEIEEVFNQAVAEAEQGPAERYPEIANMYHGPIIAKVEESKYDEAEALGRQSVEMHLSLLGQNHPDTGWGYYDLGRALVPNHKFSEALDAFQQAAAIFQRTLPPGHLDAISTLERLTAVLQLARQSDQFTQIVDSPQRLDKLAATFRAALPVTGNLSSPNPTRVAARQFVTIRPALVSALNRVLPGLTTAVQSGLAELAEVNLTLEARHAAAGETQGADDCRARAQVLQEEVRSLFPRVAIESQHAFAQTQADCRHLLDSDSADPIGWNQAAWMLIMDTNPAYRNSKLAVDIAAKGAQLNPGDGSIWNALGAARTRAGDSKGAIEALTKSLELRKGGDATDWFLLAIADCQLGHKEEARVWFDKAIEWMGKNQSHEIALPLLRTEATELLGISEPAPSTDAAKQP